MVAPHSFWQGVGERRIALDNAARRRSACEAEPEPRDPERRHPRDVLTVEDDPARPGRGEPHDAARTLMGNPRILLLDEPSEGLAPLVVETLRVQLGRLKDSGLTMVLTEQNVRFVSELGDRVYILEKGMVRWTSSMPEFLSDEQVRQAYLAV